MVAGHDHGIVFDRIQYSYRTENSVYNIQIYSDSTNMPREYNTYLIRPAGLLLSSTPLICWCLRVGISTNIHDG